MVQLLIRFIKMTRKFLSIPKSLPHPDLYEFIDGKIYVVIKHTGYDEYREIIQEDMPEPIINLKGGWISSHGESNDGKEDN